MVYQPARNAISGGICVSINPLFRGHLNNTSNVMRHRDIAAGWGRLTQPENDRLRLDEGNEGEESETSVESSDSESEIYHASCRDEYRALHFQIFHVVDRLGNHRRTVSIPRTCYACRCHVVNWQGFRDKVCITSASLEIMNVRRNCHNTIIHERFRGVRQMCRACALRVWLTINRWLTSMVNRGRISIDISQHLLSLMPPFSRVVHFDAYHLFHTGM